MNQIKNRTDFKTTRKLKFFFVAFIILAGVIIGRLAYYQIGNYDYYQEKVLNQLTREASVNPERGTITDRNGNVLATNITVYNVILSPVDIISTNEKNVKKNSDKDTENDVYYEFTDEEYGIRYRGTNVS
ncbi:MAG: hypothetical protein IJC62_04645, partial [Clostridia bacterium]|nr:hypothetical protein [Clostridia bacterium]